MLKLLRLHIPLAALALLAMSASVTRAQFAQGAPPQHQGKKPRPTGPETKVAWDNFPRPDTSLVSPDSHTATTEDSLVEIVLDERGVNFAPDGSIQVVAWRVCLPKSRAGVAQLTILPAAPDRPGCSTFAYLVHMDGSVEKAASVSGGQAHFEHMAGGDLVFVGTRTYVPAAGPGKRPDFFVANTFRNTFPVRNARFWVRFPLGRPPATRAVGLGAADSTLSAGVVLKQWRSKDLPALRMEKLPLHPFDDQPLVLLDSHGDSDWLVGLCRGYLKLPAGPRLKALAATIRNQSPDPGQQLEIARSYVALKIGQSRQESVALDSLKRLTPDGVLLRERAGTYGKSVLLCGLLRQLGFNPGIALVEPRRLWSRIPALVPDIVSPVVVVPAGDPAMWLDPSSFASAPERPPIALQGLSALVVAEAQPPRERMVPFGPAAERGFSARFTGLVDSGGVVAGDLRLSLRRYEADLWRGALQTGTVAIASQALESVARQVLFVAETGEAKGENFSEPADSAALSAPFRAKDLVDRNGDTLSLHLTGRPIPEMEAGRRTQVRDLLRIYGSRRVSLDLELPANWKVLSNLGQSAQAGRYLRWSESRRIEAGRLHLDREVEVLQTSLPASDYSAYLAEELAMNLVFDRPVLFRAAH